MTASTAIPASVAAAQAAAPQRARRNADRRLHRHRRRSRARGDRRLLADEEQSGACRCLRFRATRRENGEGRAGEVGQGRRGQAAVRFLQDPARRRRAEGAAGAALPSAATVPSSTRRRTGRPTNRPRVRQRRLRTQARRRARNSARRHEDDEGGRIEAGRCEGRGCEGRRSILAAGWLVLDATRRREPSRATRPCRLGSDGAGRLAAGQEHPLSRASRSLRQLGRARSNEERARKTRLRRSGHPQLSAARPGGAIARGTRGTLDGTNDVRPTGPSAKCCAGALCMPFPRRLHELS